MNIMNKKIHSSIEKILTTAQLLKKPYVRSSNQPEALIDGYTLRWPKFGIKDAIFKGKKRI
jgi:hypothetical protein